MRKIWTPDRNGGILSPYRQHEVGSTQRPNPGRWMPILGNPGKFRYWDFAYSKDKRFWQTNWGYLERHENRPKSSRMRAHHDWGYKCYIKVWFAFTMQITWNIRLHMFRNQYYPVVNPRRNPLQLFTVIENTIISCKKKLPWPLKL